MVKGRPIKLKIQSIKNTLYYWEKVINTYLLGLFANKMGNTWAA